MSPSELYNRTKCLDRAPDLAKLIGFAFHTSPKGIGAKESGPGGVGGLGAAALIIARAFGHDLWSSFG